MYALLNWIYYNLTCFTTNNMSINIGDVIMNNNNIIGNKIKDFTLKDHNGKPFKLSDYKGERILLSFHPLAWTPVCADQMKLLEKNQKTFQDLNTIAVGISIDSIFTKKAWAETLGIKHTRLLSDFWPHGLVAKIFGIFRENDGFSERATIIIDENQNVIFRKIHEISKLPNFNEIIQFIKNMKTT